MQHKLSSQLSHRLEVTLRILIAIVLGYPLSITISICLSYVLPISKPDSIAAASMLSFAIYTAYIMWVFSTKSWRIAGAKTLISLCITGVIIVAAKSWGL